MGIIYDRMQLIEIGNLFELRKDLSMEFSKIAQEMNDRLQNGEDITVDLELDNDQNVTCATMIVLTVDEKDYIVLLPLDENGQNQDGEVWFYQYLPTANGDPELGYIEDDEEYEKVSEAFDEYLDEAEFDELIEDEDE